MPEGVGGGEGGGKPVPQPSNNVGGVEELSFQFNRGCRGWGPLTLASPVDAFCFGDRERDTYVSAPCGDGGKRYLKPPYVCPMRGEAHGD